MIDLAAPASAALPSPPRDLGCDAFLFLDFDGTLTPIVHRPDAVVADADLLELLDGLARAYDGRLAILSGRSAVQLDALLGPVAGRVAVGASHGAELRPAGRAVERAAELPAAVTDAVHRFAAAWPGVVAEIKTLGAAIHYRGAPDAAAAADREVEWLANAHGLVAQRGKMVAEVRAPGSKGKALERLAASARPVMLGDDVTDEDAFEAARRLGGAGILVGEPRATAATYHLPDVAAARAWLRALLP